MRTARALRIQDQRRQPIFVVGFPRSGTTLLAGLLSAHSRLSCGPETEFFTGLELANQGNRLCQEADWPEAAANYLFSKVHEKPIPDYYGISRDEIVSYLKRRERSCSAMLECLTESYMNRQGKQRWVEKTPTHLVCLREVRRHYPDAPIIRIIRDPRDVALSLLNVPWGPSSFAVALLQWRYFDDLSASFFEADRNSLTLRFEDVVTDPERELRKLCCFVGEEFEMSMLDTSQSIAHVNPTKIPWKQNAGRQVDPSRIAIWQRETTPAQQSEAEAIAGDRIRAYGYVQLFQFHRYLQIVNLVNLSNFPTLIENFFDGNTRFWQARPREMPQMRFFLGDPCENGWFGMSRAGRLAKVCYVTSCAAHSLASGPSLVWLGVPPVKSRQNWGFLCRVLASLLPSPIDASVFCRGEFASILTDTGKGELD
jgi:Sulfotransferase family